MKTNNTTIFTQSHFSIEQNENIEKNYKFPIFWGKYDIEERKSKGWKFGFVVTKRLK